jgi:hypothetical protein
VAFNIVCVPAGYQSPGVIVPALVGYTLVVTRYCVVKSTVSVVFAAGEIVCEIAPPSLQSAKTYRVLLFAPACGEVTAIVTCEFAGTATDAGKVYVVPLIDAVTVAPAKLVFSVTCTVFDTVSELTCAFALCGAPPPATATAAVTSAGADAETSTVTVIGK